MSIQDSSVSSDRIRSSVSSHGPFNHAQNIFLFFGGGDRGEIVDALVRALGMRESRLLTVIGEPGSGKTLMSLVLADRLKHRRNIIRYDHETISAASLLRHLLIEISPGNSDQLSNQGNSHLAKQPALPCTDLALQRLWQALQSPLPNEKPFLLLIDSDGSLDSAAHGLLEELAALRYDGRSPIQIVIFENLPLNKANGQALHTLNAGSEFYLRRLTRQEIGEYLYHQMLLFNFNQRGLFTRDTAYFIAERSEGVFSSVKHFARQAMMFANVDDSDHTTSPQLFLEDSSQAVVEKHRSQKFLSRHRGALIAFFGVSIVLSLALGIAVSG